MRRVVFTNTRKPVKIVPHVFALLLVAALFRPVFAAGDEKKDSSSSLDAKLERIDNLFEQRNYPAAERAISDAMKEHPNNADVLWRAANLAINQGDVAEDREPYYRRSVEYAEAAVKADWNNANAHAFLAAGYGSVAMYAGGEGKVKLANKIKHELDISLKLDPDNFFAHTIAGTWHREVADVSWIERKLADMFLGGLPEGSFKQSVWHFKQALKQYPDVLRNRFELGLTYIAMDRDDLAVQEFRRAIKLKSTLKADDKRKEFMRDFIADNG